MPLIFTPDDLDFQARLRDECFEVAETLLADFPADPAGWTLLGAVHRYFGDDDGADKLLSRALRLAPDWPDAHRQLGNAVTVNVANWIANNLSAVYADDKEPSP